MKLINFGRLFLGYHYFILNLSDLYLGLEMKNFKEKKESLLYALYGHALAEKPLPRGS